MRTTALAMLALLAFGPGAALAAAAPGPVPRPGMLPDSSSAVISYAPSAPQQDQRGVNVRVWTEDQRDAFNAGDRTRVFVRTSTGAYVAVLHIDTSGNLEVLYPSSPYEDGYLAAGRLYSLPGGAASSWTVRGAPGVGYIFAVASDQPLEFRSIRALFRTRQADYGDHVVYGDPYAAMDRFARLMVPDWGDVDHAVDWYSYQLGGRYSYPRYACYDSYGSWYYGRGSTYDSCDRVRLTLRDDPNYYDSRFHRADRRTYVDGGRTRYGYKEDPRLPAAAESPSGRPAVRTDRMPAAPQRTTRPADDRRNDAEPRQRPTLQRREGGDTRRPEQNPRSEPARPEPRRPEPPAREPSHESSRGGGHTSFDTWSRQSGSFSSSGRTGGASFGSSGMQRSEAGSPGRSSMPAGGSRGGPPND